jgi:uncharacterized membrane protein YsdA (DUF1294 family)
MPTVIETLSWPIIGLLGYIFLISVVTFLAFVSDKNYAMAGASRTREKTLLLLVFIGGTLGAALAMHQFRHKTKKVSFLSKFIVVVVIQLLILGAALYFFAPGLRTVPAENLTN